MNGGLTTMFLRTKGFWLLSISLIALPRTSLAGDTADLILRHGTFYPVESAGPVEGSLAVRGGRIAFLGSDAEAEKLRGSGTKVIELGGRAVTPGLIDAHSHFLGLGVALTEVDLVGTASYAEVVAKVRAAAAKAPAGSWIRGRGWDQNDWAEKGFPEHGPLSQAVPEHPVWLTRIDGHAALLNERAMAILGITAGTADPAGGRFLRDAGGRPSGVLVDNAMDIAAGKIPGPAAAEVGRILELAAQHCLERGLTTVTDMGVDQDQIDAYTAARKAGHLPLRVSAFLTDNDALLERWFQRGPEIDPEARFSVRGVKLYADGALGSRGAALVEPYTDEPGNLGLLVTGGAHMEEVARKALKAGFQVGVHAIGDRGNLVALDALEAALGGPRPEARFRVEHAQVMRLQDLERMARLGVIASMQPTHATSDMPWAGARVGPSRLRGAYAWRKVLDAGGRLALGSDFPVEAADPLLGLYAAVTRQDLAGKPDGGWLPGERLSREEALRGFTLDAAWSLFLEREVGSLAVGKRADLVVFTRDPMKVPAAEIPRAGIDYTVVDGRIVFAREGESPR
jgi:predicted amidohydrolase YtcJ